MSGKDAAGLKIEHYILLALMAAGIVFWNTTSFILSALVIPLVVGAAVFLFHERLEELRVKAWNWMVIAWHAVIDFIMQQKVVRGLKLYDVALGKNILTRRWVVDNLVRLQSMLVIGVTGSGKTTLVHSIVHFLIKYYVDRSILQLAFIDLKIGAVDFSLYKSLHLLFRPMANTVKEAEALISHALVEIERRADLYNALASSDARRRRLINDLPQYHKVREELHLYASLPEIPLLLIFIDEVSVFTRSSKQLDALVKIAEQGRAFGVNLVVCTQYPTRQSIPPVLRQQLPTRFIFGMAPTGYQVAEVYAQTMPSYEIGKHECYASLGNSGRHFICLRTNILPREELERMVHLRSGEEPDTWDDYEELANVDVETDLRQPWTGQSHEQKKAALWMWLDQFHERPSADEFTKDFQASKRTGDTWIPRVWAEKFGDRDAVNPNVPPPQEE